MRKAVLILIISGVFLSGCYKNPSPPSSSSYQIDTPTGMIKYLDRQNLPALVSVKLWPNKYGDGLELVTRHYRIFTTLLEPLMLNQVPGFVESSWRAYNSQLPEPVQSTRRLTIYLFAERSQWEKFTDEFAGRQAKLYRKITAGAYYLKGACVAYNIGRERTFSVLGHEGWHQFNKRIFKYRLPSWLDEGVAMLFEASVYKDGFFYFRPAKNTHRLGGLRKTLLEDKMIPLETLVSINPGEILAMENPNEMVTAFYSQAYALVRFLRATAGALSFALIFAMTRLFRVASIPSFSEPLAQLEKVKAIVAKSRYTYANLALLGDKKFLFSHSGNAFIMYAVEGRSWIAMGNPVGPEQEWDDLIWQFYEMCHKYGGWPVFYEIQEDKLRFYLDLGLSFLKIGEEGHVCLKDFSLEGGTYKNLRYTCRKFEKEGYVFKVIHPDEIENFMDQLRIVSDAWLREKNTREKSFSLGHFDEQYLKLFPIAVVLEQGKIVAFTNLWSGADKEELSADIVRYLSRSPYGLMDYLFIQLMLWGKQQRYNWFSLGMAPLSGLEEHTSGRRWNQAATFVFRYGGHFYNFQGLRKYKEKFRPDWQPKYIVCPGGLAVPRILINLISLSSGGLKGTITK